MKAISILLALDQALVRQSWNLILSSQPRYRIVGECCTGDQALELVRQTLPDIVVIDFDMPGTDGLEVSRLIRTSSPATSVIVVSSQGLAAYACRVLQDGNRGFITKHSSIKELFAAINEVLAGRAYICEEIKYKIASQVIYGEGAFSAFNSLTTREKEIVRMVKQGQPSVQIARQLSISSKTVETHRYNILKKLKLKNTIALVNFANHHLFY
jgi:DNA-binding NarL/FixJ family response regulator